MVNLPLLTDSYKLGHHLMYPDKTSHVYSYYESRAGSKYGQTTFFGLQYIIKKYLEGKVVLLPDLHEGVAFCEAHFGASQMFNFDMWYHIWKEYDGYLPLEIRAVPEGITVPNGNVLMTVTNTDPKCAALVNHFETLLCQVWYPCNVATLGRLSKDMMLDFLRRTSEKLDHIYFQLHDFGMRGVSSMESAGIGGAAHLVNFRGTDTVIGIQTADKYYRSGICGLSVPASEHSVMTALGQEGEMEVVDHLIKTFPNGILSVVSDSYDIYEACRTYGTRFKEAILARNGTFVVRPDSGDPPKVVVGCLTILEQNFGSTKNSKGYKVLPPQIRLIWGDGVGFDDIREILQAMMDSGWSAENIVFGMGGGLLQKHNRDTQKFAFKTSAICIDGTWHDVNKRPTHDGSKASKPGMLKLITEDGEYKTVSISDPREDKLELVFRNGELLRDESFDDIRLRADLLTPAAV